MVSNRNPDGGCAIRDAVGRHLLRVRIDALEGSPGVADLPDIALANGKLTAARAGRDGLDEPRRQAIELRNAINGWWR